MAFATCMATAFEQRRLLPVDAMVPDPLFTSTHAITIDAAPDQVWPWIAIVVLASALLRAPRAAATADPLTFSSTPGRWARSVRATPQERTQRKQLIGIARRAVLTMSRLSAFKTADRQAACAR
jgi:hypothetical protein